MKALTTILLLLASIFIYLSLVELDDVPKTQKKPRNNQTQANRKSNIKSNTQSNTQSHKPKRLSSETDQDTLRWDLHHNVLNEYLAITDEQSLIRADEIILKQYERLENMGFLASRALDLSAKEIAYFYQQHDDLPPSNYLHFFLESYGGLLWSVQQSIQTHSGPLKLEATINAFLKDERDKNEQKWIGISYLSQNGKNIVVMLSAPNTMYMPKTKKFHALNDSYVIKGNINENYQNAHLVIAKPDGSFYEIKADELKASTQLIKKGIKNYPHTYPFALELIFDQEGIWDIEILAEGQFGPSPLGQVRFYVDQTAPDYRMGQLLNRTSIKDLDLDKQVDVIQKLERQALEILNHDREEFGLAALELDSHLSLIAMSHSEDMNQNQFFGHTSPNSGTMADRLKQAKYRSVSAGENVALNQSIDEAQKGLMYSIGHRQNILSKDFNKVGIGIAIKDHNIYLTQLFAKKAPIYQASQYPTLIKGIYDKINEKREKINRSPIQFNEKLSKIAAWNIDQNTNLNQVLNHAKKKEIYGKMSVSSINVSEVEQFDVADELLNEEIKEIGIAVYQKPNIDGPSLKIIIFTLIP